LEVATPEGWFTLQIVFFGAEVTWVCDNRYGSRIVPAPEAVRSADEALPRQGVLTGGEIREAT
jgi:hypothetical protein